MNSLLKLAVLLLVVFSSCHCEQEEEVKTGEGVLILTTATFKKAINDNEHILVLFHAPWSTNYKTLASEYVKAAKKLEEEGSAIKLATFDWTKEPELAKLNQFRQDGLAVIKLYRNGNPIEYNGGGGRSPTADEIVTWLKKKAGQPATTLETTEQVKKFAEDSEVAIVGFFSDADSSAAKEFLKVADGIGDLPFAIVYKSDIAKENNIDGDAVVVFKKFESGRDELTSDFQDEKIAQFIRVGSFPLIVDFNKETDRKIFRQGETRNHVLLFLSKEAGHYEKYIERQEGNAKNFQDKLSFVTLNVDEDDSRLVLQFLGMKEEEVPAVRVIKLKDGLLKYNPQTDVLNDEAAMKTFVTDFLDGKVKPQYPQKDEL